jgi:hypothetical protein
MASWSLEATSNTPGKDSWSGEQKALLTPEHKSRMNPGAQRTALMIFPVAIQSRRILLGSCFRDNLNYLVNKLFVFDLFLKLIMIFKLSL